MSKLKLIPALEQAQSTAEYDAVWTGNCLTVKLGTTEQKLKTEMGIRGTIRVKVLYENGKPVIVGHENTKIL